MDPMTIGAISGGVQLLGGVLGNIFSSDDRDAAEAAMNAAFQEIMSIPEGPDLARPIILEKFQQAGLLNKQVLTKLEEQLIPAVKIELNPELSTKRRANIAALEQLVRSGFSAQDALALEKTRRTAAQDAQSRTEAIKQQVPMGSGDALAAMLQINQAASDRQAMENMGIAANAQNATIAALDKLSSQYSALQNEEMSRQAKNAELMRQRDLFIAENATARQKDNALFADAANRFNIGRQQNVRDANVTASNAELNRQRQAEQLMYDNYLKRAGLRAQAYGGKAGMHQQNAANTAQNWQNIASGAGSFGMGMAGMMQKQQMHNDQMGLGWANAANRSPGSVSFNPASDTPMTDTYFGTDYSPGLSYPRYPGRNWSI